MAHWHKGIIYYVTEVVPKKLFYLVASKWGGDASAKAWQQECVTACPNPASKTRPVLYEYQTTRCAVEQTAHEDKLPETFLPYAQQSFERFQKETCNHTIHASWFMFILIAVLAISLIACSFLLIFRAPALAFGIIFLLAVLFIIIAALVLFLLSEFRTLETNHVFQFKEQLTLINKLIGLDALSQSTGSETYKQTASDIAKNDRNPVYSKSLTSEYVARSAIDQNVDQNHSRSLDGIVRAIFRKLPFTRRNNSIPPYHGKN